MQVHKKLIIIAAEALRKEFAQDTEDLLLQAELLKWLTSTNLVTVVNVQEDLEALEDECWVECYAGRMLQFKIQKLDSCRFDLWEEGDLEQMGYRNRRMKEGVVGNPTEPLVHRVSSFDLEATKIVTMLEQIVDRKSTPGVAYLEKDDGIQSFMRLSAFYGSSFHYASLYITAKVAGKPMNISEASIRSDLLFDDADGIDSLHNQVIFDAIQLMGHLDEKKKFVMYPRFISVFLDKQLKNVPVPLDHFSINALTSKDEGEASERQFEPQPTPSPPHLSADQHETQPDPSPRPSPTIPIPNSIPEGSGGNHRG
ncbi:hypothetical protein Tco_0972023 [Tanacetum coccineum]